MTFTSLPRVRRLGLRGLTLVAAASTVGAVACKKEPPPAPPPAEPAPPPAPPPVEVDPTAHDFFKSLPARFDSQDNPITEEKVALGRMLFFETRLSKNHDVSCNSCHALDKFGVDGQVFSSGHKQQKGGRNSPTVYNAGEHVAQFWDGRAASLEEQAKGPILNPVEMAMPSEKKVIATLKSIPGYVEAFKKAFPGQKDPVTYDNLGRAIGAFERQLVTPGRFDKFLAGEKTALDDQEKRGLNKFVTLGCTTCHNGPAVGGSSFQKLGLVKAFPNEKDLGRFDVTKDEGDRLKFRVPSLRNVDKTGPYLHDGSVTDLAEMVRIMADHQLGKPVTDEDVADIVAFLKALTGELPAEYIAAPTLPPSGPKTPKPDPS
jgi:cytochrome c peroxidase